MKHLIFTLGKEYFGIPIDQAKEVVKGSEIHPLPESPAFIEGVISLKNRSLAVIDLSKRFQIFSNSSKKNFLIAKLNRLIVALAVEKVIDVIDLSTPEYPSTTSTAEDQKIVGGISEIEGKFITRLNLSKLLNSEEEGQLVSYRG